MSRIANPLLQLTVSALAVLTLAAGAQTQSPPPAPAPAPAAAPPSNTPANWRFAGVDWTGFVDGYYGFNNNHPANSANGQTNDLYNFDDKTNQADLDAAKITFNRDPAPVGVHADFIFGRTNSLIHPGTTKYDPYSLEQAYVAGKPPRTHGAEIDFGQFVTSAGAETIEAKDNWNYSRSLLFAWAIPYYHFGLRTSVPATKTWTPGLQIVNGWNNVVNNEGGPTVGLTSAYTKAKYTWSFNLYTGPEKSSGLSEYRNLIDTTVLLTPNSKFNAYVNYDYGQNHTSAYTAQSVTIPGSSAHWQGIALAAHEAVAGKNAVSGRWEYFSDNAGFATGTSQHVQEGTGTFEHKWNDHYIARAEYRHDWSSQDVFHKGANSLVDGQSTLTAGFILVLAPGR